MKTTIKLKTDAFPVCRLNYHEPDRWYSAPAVDEDGNPYHVYWYIRDDFYAAMKAAEEEENILYHAAILDDEGRACDWATPCQIFDGQGQDEYNPDDFIILGCDGKPLV